MRASQSLKEGAGAEIYKNKDDETGWYNCIPPVGMVVFVALSTFGPPAAAVAWGAINVGLLVACVGVLRRIYAKLTVERIHYEATFPILVALLLVFGSASIRTGQTSLLFAACWLGYVLTTSERRQMLAGFLLAVPASLKLYPILFGFVPLLRRKWGEVAWAPFWLAFLTVAVPALLFREQIGEMLAAFWQYQILDPGGRVGAAFEPRVIGNQDFGAVLLRYFTYSPEFHSAAPWFPHANLDAEQVIQFSNVLRLIVVVATVIASGRWLRTATDEPPLVLVALWTAALYFVLPGMKARYAVYLVPAFTVLIAQAHLRLSENRAAGIRYSVVVAACVVLVMQTVPSVLMRIGIGFFGPALIWILLMQIALSRRAGQDDAARRERAANVL